MLNLGIFSFCFLCYWGNFNIAGIYAEDNLKNQNGEPENTTVEQILPVSSWLNRQLIPERIQEESDVEQNFPHEIRHRSLYESPRREDFILQTQHLRYLMSSTVEQSDNSSRSSTFNIWLTILIAALAAAIFS